jgi:hypothetical protein
MGKLIAFCADGTWDTPECATDIFGLYIGKGADGMPLEQLKGCGFGEGIF